LPALAHVGTGHGQIHEAGVANVKELPQLFYSITIVRIQRQKAGCSPASTRIPGGMAPSTMCRFRNSECGSLVEKWHSDFVSACCLPPPGPELVAWMKSIKFWLSIDSPPNLQRCLSRFLEKGAILLADPCLWDIDL
jgi:hypothetical protein